MLLAFICGLCSVHDLQSNFHQSFAVGEMGCAHIARCDLCDPVAQLLMTFSSAWHGTQARVHVWRSYRAIHSAYYRWTYYEREIYDTIFHKFYSLIISNYTLLFVNFKIVIYNFNFRLTRSKSLNLCSH
jgi:hypothetical protein